MKNLLAILFSVLFFLPAAQGQSQSEIYGEVSAAQSHSWNDGLGAVNVYAYRNDSMIICTETDSNGNYSLKPLYPGLYDVYFIHSDFMLKKITGIILPSGSSSHQKIKLDLLPKQRKRRWIF